MSDADITARDRQWLDELGIRFSRDGYLYSILIKDIITDERYRRVK